MSRSCKVAVIGAGVAGLVAARELLREGHQVVVFEKSNQLGGMWVYDPRVESDPLGRDPDREVVHGSVYRYLRTNLPRQLMGFLDYPFPEPSRSYGDTRAFPGHEEVLSFIKDFARYFGIAETIRFGTEVVRVVPGGRKDEWVVESRGAGPLGSGSDHVAETFEAVVVCNGHHTQPRIAEIPGIERWPGRQTHSHNYRTPEPFLDQEFISIVPSIETLWARNQYVSFGSSMGKMTVVLIGKGASAHDISREIAKVAKEVHLTSRSKDVVVTRLDGYDNIWQQLMIKHVHEDGSVVFEDSSSVVADVIFHCTGYNYHFPFLETGGVVTVEDNCVGPLYSHVFPPHLAPWISFVGIPNKVIIFLTMELHSKWIAHALSGKLKLPTEEEMMASVKELYSQMEETRKPKCHAHSIHPNEMEYLNWLVAEVGLPSLEEWRVQIYTAVLKCTLTHNDTYRDTDYWCRQINSARQRHNEGEGNGL